MSNNFLLNTLHIDINIIGFTTTNSDMTKNQIIVDNLTNDQVRLNQLYL